MMSYSEFKYSDYFKTELPSHWQEKRLGFLSMQTKNAFVDGPFGSDLKSDDYLDEGIPLIQLNNIRDGKHILRNMKFISQNKKIDLIRHLALPQDIVIAKMAEPVARAAVVSDEYDEYVIVADCVKLSPDLELVDLNFLIWAINSDCVRENAELVSTGTTRIRINLGELKKLKVPYPSLSEQVKIRQYLDHETAKIDTLIAKQEELIALLKEKRQAVISHAVTKGLNPNVPMKDSGVEWLGEVPEHWTVSKFGYISQVVRGGSPRPAGDPALFNGDYSPWVTVAEITKDDELYLTSTETFLTKKGSEQCRVFQSGTLLLSNSGATLGVPKILSINANANDGVVGFEDLKIDIEYAYFYLSILTNDLRERVKQGSGQPNLNTDIVKAIPIAIPPENEIKKIVVDIKKKIDHFSKLMGSAEKAIQLMQERRTALISAVVTGKIDVRNWQHLNKNNNQDNMELSA
ncbi:type I restriction modification DNA specificity domain protein [Acinetobacter sp. 1130196]|uniref:Type I restriction-modification system specificity determinant n=4 Tax=Acinetobacter calcoaceticus/baumannii complex TaxID=909768 RepID=A0AA36KDW6_ACINO|nr:MULTISPECIES: restriction endonuclease subunit S [Acinetobacter]EXE99604.1 type I restriction modification DNA specificity domain protein [Acinetobacter sp. 259052]EXH74796.1 type I restriction modification DNA specificity domain protein [Acinetobacter sp. 216872]EXR17539.1 type I restriction modification DNA specificity domain protein [Acinetobacter sp. 1130196]EYT20939.1 type I restriction modification DNA specificity domain protein [Acinetobacter sp. 1592897]KCX90981.1 type I restriction